MKYGKNWIKTRPVPDFYKDVLFWFRETTPIKEPHNGRQVRSQCIWNNVSVCVDRKTLFSRSLYRAGVKYIDDFLDAQGRILSYQGFTELHPNVSLSPLTYMGGPEQSLYNGNEAHSIPPH